MPAKFFLVTGGLLASILMVAAVDLYVLRTEVVTADFADTTAAAILDDESSRPALVDLLVDNWIDENQDRLTVAGETVDESQIRAGIDALLATPELRAELSSAVAEVGTRQDALVDETVRLDLGPALEASAVPLPPEVERALGDRATVEFARDMSQLSRARFLLRVGFYAAAFGAAVLIVLMLLASQSFRRTNRAVVAFGLPLSLLQQAGVERLAEVAPGFTGETTYSTVVADLLVQTLQPRVGAIVLAFSALAAIEVGSYGVALVRSSRKAADSHTEPVGDAPGAQQRTFDRLEEVSARALARRTEHVQSPAELGVVAEPDHVVGRAA